jgi:hypothetical protein
MERKHVADTLLDDAKNFTVVHRCGYRVPKVYGG